MICPQCGTETGNIVILHVQDGIGYYPGKPIAVLIGNHQYMGEVVGVYFYSHREKPEFAIHVKINERPVSLAEVGKVL